MIHRDDVELKSLRDKQ